ncbi:MAG: hypothetical protein EPN25_04560 [Nitrospirae bacterium]|nr:MAG: hypothetical protein EPN25_04560 [Nitrospirota bacterium]
MKELSAIEEVKGLYTITPLTIFRRTPGVTFDFVPVAGLPRIDAVDRVIHHGNAASPGRVDQIERPWYMHPAQEDNLIVLYGTRSVELYSHEHGRIEEFVVTPHEIRSGDRVICQGGVIFSWPRRVFHRVRSFDEGSASINLAVHREGFDIKTNFNIYDLDISTGKFRVIREGHVDQFL